MLKRALVTAWLNVLANAKSQLGVAVMHEAIDWLKKYKESSVQSSDDAWSKCDDDANSSERWVMYRPISSQSQGLLLSQWRSSFVHV